MEWITFFKWILFISFSHCNPDYCCMDECKWFWALVWTRFKKSIFLAWAMILIWKKKNNEWHEIKIKIKPNNCFLRTIAMTRCAIECNIAWMPLASCVYKAVGCVCVCVKWTNVKCCGLQNRGMTVLQITAFITLQFSNVFSPSFSLALKSLVHILFLSL